MKEIQSVVFPLNLGTANKITIGMSVNPFQSGARLSYLLLDGTVTPVKHLSQGTFTLTEEQFTSHGNDKEWIENYVAEQLGVTFI